MEMITIQRDEERKKSINQRCSSLLLFLVFDSYSPTRTRSMHSKSQMSEERLGRGLSQRTAVHTCRVVQSTMTVPRAPGVVMLSCPLSVRNST
jgi:hypothetical protein